MNLIFWEGGQPNECSVAMTTGVHVTHVTKKLIKFSPSLPLSEESNLLSFLKLT